MARGILATRQPLTLAEELSVLAEPEAHTSGSTTAVALTMRAVPRDTAPQSVCVCVCWLRLMALGRPLLSRRPPVHLAAGNSIARPTPRACRILSNRACSWFSGRLFWNSALTLTTVSIFDLTSWSWCAAELKAVPQTIRLRLFKHSIHSSASLHSSALRAVPEIIHPHLFTD